jgi:CO/xanthine dehydrogenase Mo-binding subunit
MRCTETFPDEASTDTSATAVLNAVHAATGKPVRSLPLKNVKLA